jgi:anti-sigma factor RsiW
MKINRHNYEEIFLLYVDNELTAAERALVDSFIEENPDLKNEMELLHHATVQIDAKLDEDFKTSLMKPVDETAVVSEEQMLLYIDGELKADETSIVKHAIAADAHLQKELQWLQRSKLSADASIVFPDKSLLYKEAQPARVFYMSSAVKRWSAAAAVLLMLGTGYWLMDKPTADTPVAQTQDPVQLQPQTQSVIDTSSTKVPDAGTNALVKEQPAAQQPVKITVTAPVQIKKLPPASVQQQQNNIAVTNTTQQKQAPVVQQPEQQLQTQEAIVKTEINPEVISNNPTTSSVQPQTSIAKTNITFVNNNEEGDENEQTGLLNENRQRSSGLKAFIKKAKRTLERRTGIQSGESQVRFAVFAVNTQ